MAAKTAEYRALPESEKRLYRARRPSRAAGAAASKAEKLGVPLKRLVYARTLAEIEGLCSELGVDLTQRVARQSRNRGDGIKRFGEVVGFVTYVPKETESVLVTYSDKADGRGSGRGPVGEIRVSAFTAPGEQKASFTQRGNVIEFTMQRPKLMLTQKFSASRTLRMSGSSYSETKIMEVVEANRRIMVRPYRPANVYDDGKICTGSGNDRPKSLRSSWNLFWGAPFNADLLGRSPDLCDHTCPHIQHRSRGCGGPNRRHRHRLTAVCGCVNERPNSPNSQHPTLCNNCGGVLRSLLHEKQKNMQEVDPCSALSSDQCCSCQCACCTQRCSCRCSCDQLPKYADAIKNYSTQRVAEDWTRSLTQPKFFSATGEYDGVFVSSKKPMLELVDEEHHHTAFNRLVVFGLFKVLDGERIAVQFGKDKAYTMLRDEVQAFAENNNSGRRSEVR